MPRNRNFRQWSCPACNHDISTSANLTSHIRAKHSALDEHSLQCWRLFFSPDGTASYDKNTFSEAPGLPHSSPNSSPLSQQQVCNQSTGQLAVGAVRKKRSSKQLPHTPADIRKAGRKKPGRPLGSKNKGIGRNPHTHTPRQNTSATSKSGTADAIGVKTPAQQPALTNMQHSPNHQAVVDVQGGDRPHEQTQIADTKQAEADELHEQAQQATADQPEREQQLGGSDKLEMVRIALNFAENIAKM